MASQIICQKRVAKEYKDANEAKSYEMIPTEDMMVALVRFEMNGGVYDGQQHVIEVKFIWGAGPDKHYYPNNPPLVTFKTPIWHPNISGFPGGAVCLDFLKQEGLWVPTCNIEGLVNMIKAMMDDPNPSSPQNPEAGNKYKELMGSGTDDSKWKSFCKAYYQEREKTCKDLFDKFTGKKLEEKSYVPPTPSPKEKSKFSKETQKKEKSKSSTDISDRIEDDDSEDTSDLFEDYLKPKLEEKKKLRGKSKK